MFFSIMDVFNDEPLIFVSSPEQNDPIQLELKEKIKTNLARIEHYTLNRIPTVNILLYYRFVCLYTEYRA